jgi:hypothetical protein
VVVLDLLIRRLGHASDWAAWAQAIGTVGAVIAAAEIARRQSRDSAAREAATVRARLMTASRLATLFSVRASAFLSRCDDGVDERTLNPVLLRSFEASRALLNRFPMEALSTPEAVLAFTQSLQLAEYVMSWLNDTYTIQEKYPQQQAQTLELQLQYLRPLVQELDQWQSHLRDLAEPGWRAAEAT